MWVRAEREEPPTEAAAKVANAALLIDVRFGFGQSSSSVCGRVCSMHGTMHHLQLSCSFFVRRL